MLLVEVAGRAQPPRPAAFILTEIYLLTLPLGQGCIVRVGEIVQEGKVMGTQLHIGEVAKLLGVSAKTIRHYHKVGLLAEPPRSDGGYRLYTASDLVRLQRIRRLQALGLSLKQIKTLLGEHVSQRERSLREVLQALLEELSD